jgi:hypothetical protein
MKLRNQITSSNGNGHTLAEEIPLLEEAARKICSSKKKSLELLLATGMYTPRGNFQRRFR